MTTDLWTEASRDVEAENRSYALEIAKSAGAGTWAFLALAQSRQEFADRVALATTSITTAAARAGIAPEDLLKVFTERFALLMQAKDGNPFADEDDDSDDDKAKGDGKSDSAGDDDADDEDTDDSNSDVDDAGTDETDDNGKDGGDDTEQDDGGDDNADDSEAGKDKDDDQAQDLDQRESPAFGGIYSSLMQRIEAGEDPLTWGGRPFVSSLGRTAVGADESPVTDTNVPNPTADAGAPPMGGMGGMGGTDPMGMPPAEALTTKPRQTPGGDQGLNTPPGDPGLDPAMNGGDIEAGQSNEGTAKIAVIAADVQRSNPSLSQARCRKIATAVVRRYLKTAEDLSPLLYGDRSNTPDGPLTQKVKNWSPPDLTSLPKGPQGPGEGSQDSGEGEGGGEGGGGGAEGAGEAAGEGAAGEAGAAGVAGEAAELAPLLLL